MHLVELRRTETFFFMINSDDSHEAETIAMESLTKDDDNGKQWLGDSESETVTHKV